MSFKEETRQYIHHKGILSPDEIIDIAHELVNLKEFDNLDDAIDFIYHEMYNSPKYKAMFRDLFTDGNNGWDWVRPNPIDTHKYFSYDDLPPSPHQEEPKQYEQKNGKKRTVFVINDEENGK